MRKQTGICAAVLAVMLLATGCGAKEERTTLHIKDGGKVVENVTEEFDKDNYDEKELEKFVDQEIEEYIDKSGEKSIKSSGFSVEDGKAYMTLKFDDTKVYSDFNQETLYQGTVVQAEADGYPLAEHFYAVKDGKVKKNQTDKKISDGDDYKVIVTSESIDVAAPGEVVFVSRNDVKIRDEKTVSIRKENEDDTSLTYIVYK